MKKAQAPTLNPQSYTALLIFIIGLSLVIYIMFLPPSDRAELLEQNRTRAGDDDVKDYITILMTKEPGRLSNIQDDEIIKDLPSFNLFTRTDAGVIEEFDSLDVQRSLFEEIKRNMSFDITNPDNTENVVLSYSLLQYEGELQIKLNGVVILSRELATPSPSPMTLQKSLLEEHNELEFSVSSPGIEFWKSNKYTLSNIKITADVTETSSQENLQSFYVTEKEKENLDSLEFSFVADCKAIDSGPISIYLNKRLIYNSVPDCGAKTELPLIGGERVNEGENNLLFRVEKGNYLLTLMEVQLNLKEPIYTTYFFQVDDETYQDIEDDVADVNVTVVFPNSIERKKGIIIINDFMTEVDTYDAFFTRNIDPFIRKNNNAIEIRPKTDFLDITELKIVLAE